MDIDKLREAHRAILGAVVQVTFLDACKNEEMRATAIDKLGRHITAATENWNEPQEAAFAAATPEMHSYRDFQYASIHAAMLQACSDALDGVHHEVGKFPAIDEQYIERLVNECAQAELKSVDHNSELKSEPAKVREHSDDFRSVKKPGATANARMIEAYQRDPERLSWTARQWGEHLGVTASAVTQTNAWRHLMQLREVERSRRAERR